MRRSETPASIAGATFSVLWIYDGMVIKRFQAVRIFKLRHYPPVCNCEAVAARRS